MPSSVRSPQAETQNRAQGQLVRPSGLRFPDFRPEQTGQMDSRSGENRWETQSRSHVRAAAQSMISKRMSGVILTLAAILLLSACTRERVAEEAGNASEPPQEEPVVMEPDTPQPAATETPLPTPEDTPVPSTVTYEVKPGDTLSTISEKFGTEIQRIREMNLLTTDSAPGGAGAAYALCARPDYARRQSLRPPPSRSSTLFKRAIRYCRLRFATTYP